MSDEEEEKIPKISKKELPTYIQELYNVSEKFENFVIKVYITKPPLGGRGAVSKEFVDQYYNEFVDDIFIKEQLGPGKYECVLLVKGKNLNTKRINVMGVPWGEDEESYNNKRTSHSELDTLMKFGTAIGPLIKDIIVAVKGQKDPLSSMNGFVKQVGESQLKMLSTFQTEFMKNMKQIKEVPEVQPVQEQQDHVGKEIVMKIVDTIAEYVDVFKKGGTVTKQAVAENLKDAGQKDEATKKVFDDPEMTMALYAQMCKDPRIGPDVAKDLAERTGLNIKVNEEQPTT